MKLNAFDGKLFVANAHDDVVSRPSAYGQIARQGGGVNDQGMVAHGGERIFQRSENGSIVMDDLRQFAVHNRRRANDFRPESRADALVTETNAQDRRAGAEATNDGTRNAGFFGCARAGRDDNFVRPQRYYFIEGNLIVAEDPDLRTQFAKVMVEVVSE